MITVAIVDDHPVVRAGLRSILNTAGDISIVGEGASGRDALCLVSEHSPDVLVLDLNLPEIDGLEVARVLAHQNTHSKILVLTIHRAGSSVLGLLELGVLGFVIKDEAMETLIAAVRAVARGENWLSPSAATQLVQAAIHPDAADSKKTNRKDLTQLLTPRENEILALLAAGLDNRQIARQLVLTTRTVQNHVSNIYGKLGVSSRTEAVLFALQNGWVKISDSGIKSLPED